LTEWLKDLATSVEYTAEKTNEEIGQSARIIADLRLRIEKSITETAPPKTAKIHRLGKLPVTER